MSVAVRALAPFAVALALVLAGCGSGGGPAGSPLAAGAPLKIGYLASLTGFCAGFARQYVAGARLAVGEINARGGVLGHRLELIVRDDRATPAVGVRRARELVEGEHIKYLAGTCVGAVGTSVAQLVANPDHVLYAVGISDPTAFAGGPRAYAFDTIPTARVEGMNAAAYVRAHPRWRRVGVIAEAYGYGYQVTAAFRQALRGSGQTVVSEGYVPSGGRDYRPYIERLLAARPDAIFSAVVTEDAVTLVEDGLGLGLFAKGRSFLGVMDYATLGAMARAPVGVEGYTCYPSASIYRTPFARELRALGRPVADGGAAGDAFNQIELIAQGIEKARSTDPSRVREALAGSRVRMVQGEVRVPRCTHELAAPIAMGTVVGPNAGTLFAHFQPLRLVGTGGYLAC